MQKIIEEIGLSTFLKSRAKGLFIGTVIGFMWFFYGVSLITGSAKYLLLVFGVAITFILFRYSRKVKKKGNEMGESTNLQIKSYKKKSRFFIINTIAEIILLNLVYFYLIKIGQEKIVIPVISIVVGLHFIPMALVLRIKEYYIAIVLMIISGLVFVILANKLDENVVTIFQSLLNGLALWLTVAISLRNISHKYLHSPVGT